MRVLPHPSSSEKVINGKIWEEVEVHGCLGLDLHLRKFKQPVKEGASPECDRFPVSWGQKCVRPGVRYRTCVIPTSQGSFSKKAVREGCVPG